MNRYTGRARQFLERLQTEVLIGDGAMGTLLYSHGTQLDVNFEHLNLINPSLVEQVHRDYAAAGAQLIETNTFGANALRLSAIGLEKKTRDINLAGARIARSTVGPDRFVAGSIGPLLQPRGDKEDLSDEEKTEIFRQQMEALADGGVDLFILETFASMADLTLALQVSKELDIPSIAQMAFLEEGRTREGVSPQEACRHLEIAGASVVGANCGSGPRGMLQVLKAMESVATHPLSAFANSGFPQYVNGRYLYLATPEYFAAMARDMVSSGVSLIGGCCGTTPEHIAALAGALSGTPIQRKARVSIPEPSAAQHREEAPAPRSTFLDAKGLQPVITVELDPPRGLDCSKTLSGARKVARAGANAISLAENPLARIRMGNLALAARIQQETGIDVIAHVTCRDRNLIGLHSDLMGAHLMGLRNVLAVTGDPVSVGNESGASSVFDLNSIGLLNLLSSLNSGTTMMGTDLGGTTDFFLGAAFNPNGRSMEGQLRRLQKKKEAGACFVQTQPIYSARILEEVLEKTAPMDIPVLVGIMPLVSERNAEFLHNEVPGISLPEEVRRRMRGKQGEEGVKEGMAIAAELIECSREKAFGYYLMPPFGKVNLALELIRLIRG